MPLNYFLDALIFSDMQVESLIEIYNFEIDGSTLSKVLRFCANTQIVKFIDVKFKSLKDFYMNADTTKHEIFELCFSYWNDKDDCSNKNILKAISKICDLGDVESSLKRISFESFTLTTKEFNEILKMVFVRKIEWLNKSNSEEKLKQMHKDIQNAKLIESNNEESKGQVDTYNSKIL